MRTKIGMLAAMLAMGMAGEAQGKKFSFGSGKAGKSVDAPKNDDDVETGSAIADGLDLADDALDYAVGGGSDDNEDAPVAQREETHDLGTGIVVERSGFGRRTLLRVSRGGGSEIITPSDASKPLAIEAARLLNLRILPATGTVDREALVAQGVLRPATDADVAAWEARAKARGGFGGGRIARDAGTVYVLQRPVRGTDLLTSSAVGASREPPLILSAHLSLEQAPLGASAYYMMSDGQCFGKGSGCRAFHDGAKDVSLVTCLPGVDRDVEVHAFGVYQGDRKNKPGIKIGKRKGHKTGQVDIYVAPTAKPVVLTLGSYDPVIWAIHEAEGARVAGVLVRGFHDQGVSGTDAPVRFSTRTSGLAEGCGSYKSSYTAKPARETWAVETRALFGRDVAQFDGKNTGRLFAVGAWNGLEAATPLPVDIATIRSSGQVATVSLMDDAPAGRLMLLGAGVFLFRRRIMGYING